MKLHQTKADEYENSRATLAYSVYNQTVLCLHAYSYTVQTHALSANIDFESKKEGLLSATSPNIDRFSKFFHRQTQR